jgi:hypothetical protein
MGGAETSGVLVGCGLAQVPDPAATVREPSQTARWYALTMAAAFTALIGLTELLLGHGGAAMVLLGILAGLVGAAQATWRAYRGSPARPARASAVSQMLSGAPLVVPFLLVGSVADGVISALTVGAVFAVVWLVNRSAFWAVTARALRTGADDAG